jgi:hypothetical protein
MLISYAYVRGDKISEHDKEKYYKFLLVVVATVSNHLLVLVRVSFKRDINCLTSCGAYRRVIIIK